MNDQVALVICRDFNSLQKCVILSHLIQGSVYTTHQDLKVNLCGVLESAWTFLGKLNLACIYSS